MERYTAVFVEGAPVHFNVGCFSDASAVPRRISVNDLSLIRLTELGKQCVFGSGPILKIDVINLYLISDPVTVAFLPFRYTCRLFLIYLAM